MRRNFAEFSSETKVRNLFAEILDFCRISAKFGLVHSTVYVDDTVLLFASKSVAEIELKLKCDLNRITNWMQTNQITLNIKGQLFQRSLASV